MTGPTPERRRRLPALLPQEMDEEQNALYQRIVHSPRATRNRSVALTDGRGRLLGPFDPMLRAPRVGTALEAAGVALRYGTSLPDRMREMAILAVAAHWQSGFEQAAHRSAGRDAGLSEEDIAALDAGANPAGADAGEVAALDTVRAMLAEWDLGDDAYERAVATLGEQATFELTALVGHYSLLALEMRVFGIGAEG